MRRRVLAALFLLVTGAGALPAQNVLVVYHSQMGHTEAMANAVAEGAQGVDGADVKLMTIDEAAAGDLLWADAIIVGSPVHNANPAAAVLEFISSWPFDGQPLKDKLGAAFVTGGGISAGEEATQLAILRAMLIYNLVVVGGPDWRTAFGASAVTEEEPFAETRDESLVHPTFRIKGKALGQRVAELAGRLTGLSE
jgi:NAD(P)H dehydrogenase (quinone)